MISKNERCVTVSSLKGNTLGILEKLDPNDFGYAMRITNNNDPVPLWEKCKTILLGVSSYQRSDATRPEFPNQLNKYRYALEKLQNKKIVLFGSGRTEYLMYCGVLDYLEDMLKEKNEVIMKYKFEGYPKESQKIEFANKIKELIKAGVI